MQAQMSGLNEYLKAMKTIEQTERVVYETKQNIPTTDWNKQPVGEDIACYIAESVERLRNLTCTDTTADN